MLAFRAGNYSIHGPGQIIATSHEFFTPNGGEKVREITAYFREIPGW